MAMYPTLFPMDSFKLVLGLLRGDKPALKDAVGAFYDVLGYALGQFFGPLVAGAEPKLCKPDECPCKEELCDLLGNCCHQHAIPGVSLAVGLPWAKILAALLKWLPLILADEGA